jgi:hypothetical protein
VIQAEPAAVAGPPVERVTATAYTIPPHEAMHGALRNTGEQGAGGMPRVSSRSSSIGFG